VLTPHPAEAARLLTVTTAEIQENRLAAANQLQEKYGGTIVLKGAGTIVVDDANTFVCELGNPAMSTAGMGDVLSGIIGGLLAQQLLCLDAAKLAVWAHARAGDLAAQALGRHIRATEIFPFLRRLW
jgi:NAD(P)H-hydrate epimerase